MFEDAMNDSADNAAAVIGRPASVRLPHPSIEGLSVKIDRSWQLSGLLQMSPSYVVTFLDAPAIVEASEVLSQAALLALHRLTPTERRVAQLVAKGLRNDKIVEPLSRSRRTIEFQLNSLYRTLDIGRTACR